MTATLVHNSYGKCRVRLLKVRRGERHEMTDVQVDVALEGPFEAAYVAGDNRDVLPTDTMKNTVYVLAKHDPVEPIEGFAVKLAEHFLVASPRATRVHVAIAENVWSRIDVGGAPHRHAFERAGTARRTTSVTAVRGGGVAVESGIADLLLLKTTGSAFTGFAKDRYTTLKEATDRIFSTVVVARWRARDGGAFTPTWEAARRAIVEAFAEQHSLSVQHTLHAMAEAVFTACPDIEEITLSLPNKHCLLVDLSPFELANDNEIFVPTDEPHGLIEGTFRRGG